MPNWKTIAVNASLDVPWSARLNHLLGHGKHELLRSIADGLRALHSGEIGDYVTWMVVGVTVFGFTLAASLW